MSDVVEVQEAFMNVLSNSSIPGQSDFVSDTLKVLDQIALLTFDRPLNMFPDVSNENAAGLMFNTRPLAVNLQHYSPILLISHF